MIEREQETGYLETRLTRRYPDRSITFRNLGWSGDTVEGISQAGFGSVEDGYKHLVDHVLALKPTVVILGYGANESFEGKVGLPKFLKGFDRLLKAIEPTKARLVFLSPTRQEDLGPPLPDPAAHNADLALYRDALKGEAEKRGAAFVDLFKRLPDQAKANAHRPFTENGIHFSPYGYWELAAAVERGLDLPPTWAGVGAGLKPFETMISIEFPTRIDKILPIPFPPGHRPELPTKVGIWGNYPDGSAIGRFIHVSGLKPGRYSLKVDEKPIDIITFPDAPNGKSVAYLARVVEFDQVEALRQAIIAKNQLYFYRWRPQNETYLFGFRKHEQGQNAREIPQFDPLIAAKEAEIARLRVPVAHTYELIREGEVGK
jgi:lysophospholipase L1-like esterase